MNHANNLALIEVSKVWEIDGDWMRCRACRAVLIASRDGEPLRHKTECKNAAHVHPWSDLRKAMDVTPVQTGAVGSVPGARITLENLDQLSEIILDASVEGWEWTTFTRPDGSPIETVEHVAETTAHSARISEGTELHGITFAGLGDEATGPNVVCYTGNGPHSAENARAIVSLWMAAPELIRLARSALSASPTPPQAVTDVGGGAIAEISNERRRQMEAEGWSPEHDDRHSNGEIAAAAACYAAPETVYKIEMLCSGRDYEPKPNLKDLWPWHYKWWKPKDRRRDLVRAGALIVAEIERLDRANCALEPTGAGASLSDDVHADGTSAATVEKVIDQAGGRQ